MSAKLYVGSYAKYNNGSIAGAWLELNDYGDSEEFLEACAELHSDESDCELMFQDYEGFPKEFYGESLNDSDIQKIYDYIKAMDSLYSNDERDAFESWLSLYGDISANIADQISSFEDDFRGRYDSEEDYATELFDECYLHDVPESIRYYIDYEKFARDLFMDGYYFDGDYVFSRH